jgi:hypothetical protein
MLCISRVTDDTYSQKFGNNHNKFYLEFRCNLPSTTEICKRCSDKSSKVQTSRKFDHGTVNEPIPDNSHIYGSKWYYDSVKKYGDPSNDSITLAEQYQQDARNETNQEKSVKKRTKPKVSENPIIYKEISIPTHIETKMEEMEGYNIEYIKLHKVEHNGSSYFKDNKNKLYKNVKDKIGTYVGRLHNDSIMNIPDSDDET